MLQEIPLPPQVPMLHGAEQAPLGCHVCVTLVGGGALRNTRLAHAVESRNAASNIRSCLLKYDRAKADKIV